MRKYNLSVFVLLLAVHFVWAGDIQPSVTLAEYYSSVNGKSDEAIRTALNQKINSHTTVSYDNLKYLFKWTDTYNNAGVTIDDIYSFCDPAYTEAWCSGTCGYNREHSVPKSWFGEAAPLYSDAFHLYPTNCYVNSYRGNEPFGECANGTKCTTNGVQAKGRKGSSTFSGYSGTVYEPDDEFKGDLARTYFYMVTCYMSSNFTQAEGGRVMFTYSSNTAQLTPYSIDLLLKWHRNDPVSKRELTRNEVIYGNGTYNKSSYKQGNRNPFIDYPELAEYIWGNKKGQSVALGSLVSAYDGTTPVTPDPEKPVVKYGVTWSVNGEETVVDSIVENNTVTVLPDVPVSCSMESDQFIGWTTTAISGASDEAPAVLYTRAADLPAVTADVTYYAVFAKAQTGGTATPATYTFDSEHQDGWINTANKTNAYWLLDSGKSLTSPAVDLSGLSSIAVKMRTYGGTSFNKLQVAAGDKIITTMIAESGKTMTDYEWTNTGSLEGLSPLTFTCSNAGSDKGIGFQAVTINTTGASVSYGRYITACQVETEVEIVPSDSPAKKILVGGQIYILVGEHMINMQGQRVR